MLEDDGAIGGLCSSQHFMSSAPCHSHLKITGAPPQTSQRVTTINAELGTPSPRSRSATFTQPSDSPAHTELSEKTPSAERPPGRLLPLRAPELRRPFRTRRPGSTASDSDSALRVVPSRPGRSYRS